VPKAPSSDTVGLGIKWAGNGRGCLLPSHVGGLESVVSFRSWISGGVLAENDFHRIFMARKYIWWVAYYFSEFYNL